MYIFITIKYSIRVYGPEISRQRVITTRVVGIL